MAGTIQIPGHAAGPAECPQDLLEAEPPLPKLNLMFCRKDLYPEIPGTIVRQWLTHAEFGDDMQKFMDAVHEEFGPLPSESTTTPGPAPQKDGGNDGGNDGAPASGGGKPGGAGSTKRKNAGSGISSSKRAKVDRAKIVPSQVPQS